MDVNGWLLCFQRHYHPSLSFCITSDGNEGLVHGSLGELASHPAILVLEHELKIYTTVLFCLFSILFSIFALFSYGTFGNCHINQDSYVQIQNSPETLKDLPVLFLLE